MYWQQNYRDMKKMYEDLVIKSGVGGGGGGNMIKPNERVSYVVTSSVGMGSGAGGLIAGGGGGGGVGGSN